MTPFDYLTTNFPLLKLWGPESIHNIHNVPLEPERAAKARRAVVASLIKNYQNQVFSAQENDPLIFTAFHHAEAVHVLSSKAVLGLAYKE